MHTSPFMTTFLRKFGFDKDGIIMYFKDDKAQAFADTPECKAQIERFNVL